MYNTNTVIFEFSIAFDSLYTRKINVVFLDKIRK